MSAEPAPGELGPDLYQFLGDKPYAEEDARRDFAAESAEIDAWLDKIRVAQEACKPSAPCGSCDACLAEIREVAQAPADEVFWARPKLAHIHRFARSRRAAPWSVLGAVLARLVAAVPPRVVLPPLTGGAASLNLFVGMVAASGGGKGASEAAAGDVLDLGELDPEVLTPGSGEGIAHSYALRRKASDPLEWVRDRALFSAPEVDTLTALSQRRGATLLGELRKAWSGESLGFGYSDPAKRLVLPRHSYRLALVVGIQPGRAAGLLDDTDAGTPQRFVWLPATDPAAPDTPPDDPGPLSWEMPHDILTDTGAQIRMGVCAEARAELDAARLATLRGTHAGAGGHDGLCRLKVAAALALLDGRLSVDFDDWELSGVVARMSLATREQIRAYLAAEGSRRNRARAEADAEREVIKADRLGEAAIIRVTRTLRRRLAGDWQSRGQLRRALTSTDRGYFEEGVDRLIKAGEAESTDTDRGTQYRRAAGA